MPPEELDELTLLMHSYGITDSSLNELTPVLLLERLMTNGCLLLCGL